jgi:hypothetical protein
MARCDGAGGISGTGTDDARGPHGAQARRPTTQEGRSPVSYLVVGKKTGDSWSVEIRGVGKTSASRLSGVETAARALLIAEGKADASYADLQLLLPDFEVDLDEDRMPHSGKRPDIELISGIIALIVVVGALAYVLGHVL